MGVPKNLADFVKGWVERPFNFLEYGKDDPPEVREYGRINYSDGWYEGELDKDGRRCGKGINFYSNPNGIGLYVG